MQITVTLENGEVKVHISEPAAFPVILNTMQVAVLTMMNAVVDNAPKGADLTALREELYDLYNHAASNTLEAFAPDIEMRPHLTAQAIIEAENKIIEEGRAPALNPFGTFRSKTKPKTKKAKR